MPASLSGSPLVFHIAQQTVIHITDDFVTLYPWFKMAGQHFNFVQLMIAAVFFILLMTATVIALALRHKNYQIALRKKIRKIRSEHEKELARTRLDIQEQTLQAVSRDIHDNIAMGLTLSKLHLHTVHCDGTINFQDKIDLSIHLIEEAIHNLRDISKSLNADAIRHYGLMTAVETEIGQLRETGLYCIEFKVKGEMIRMEPGLEIVLFRIIQEALNNIIKHAQADKISIQFVLDDSQFELLIEDNGKGFLSAGERPRSGSGLNNIRQRAKMIGGECEISSVVGKGSIVRVAVPLQITNKKRITYNG